MTSEGRSICQLTPKQFQRLLADAFVYFQRQNIHKQLIQKVEASLKMKLIQSGIKDESKGQLRVAALRILLNHNSRLVSLFRLFAWKLLDPPTRRLVWEFALANPNYRGAQTVFKDPSVQELLRKSKMGRVLSDKQISQIVQLVSLYYNNRPILFRQAQFSVAALFLSVFQDLKPLPSIQYLYLQSIRFLDECYFPQRARLVEDKAQIKMKLRKITEIIEPQLMLLIQKWPQDTLYIQLKSFVRSYGSTHLSRQAALFICDQCFLKQTKYELQPYAYFVIMLLHLDKSFPSAPIETFRSSVALISPDTFIQTCKTIFQDCRGFHLQLPMKGQSQQRNRIDQLIFNQNCLDPHQAYQVSDTTSQDSASTLRSKQDQKNNEFSLPLNLKSTEPLNRNTINSNRSKPGNETEGLAKSIAVSEQRKSNRHSSRKKQSESLSDMQQYFREELDQQFFDSSYQFKFHQVD